VRAPLDLHPLSHPTHVLHIAALAAAAAAAAADAAVVLASHTPPAADRISPDKPVDPAKARTPTGSARRPLFPGQADADTQQQFPGQADADTQQQLPDQADADTQQQFPDQADADTQQHGGTAAHLAAATKCKLMSAYKAGIAVWSGLGADVVEQYGWDWVKLVVDLLTFDRGDLPGSPRGGLALEVVPDRWRFPARIEINGQVGHGCMLLSVLDGGLLDSSLLQSCSDRTCCCGDFVCPLTSGCGTACAREAGTCQALCKLVKAALLRSA